LFGCAEKWEKEKWMENETYPQFGSKGKMGCPGVFHPDPPKTNLPEMGRKCERKRGWLVKLVI
jgi:hypothetical protein